MTYAIFKSCFHNTEPKLLNYTDFKHFSQEDFKEGLKEAPHNFGNSYNNFLLHFHNEVK